MPKSRPTLRKRQKMIKQSAVLQVGEALVTEREQGEEAVPKEEEVEDKVHQVEVAQDSNSKDNEQSMDCG